MSCHLQKITPLYISNTLFVVMLNLKDQLHDLDHLAVIRINREDREHCISDS